MKMLYVILFPFHIFLDPQDLHLILSCYVVVVLVSLLLCIVWDFRFLGATWQVEVGWIYIILFTNWISANSPNYLETHIDPVLPPGTILLFMNNKEHSNRNVLSSFKQDEYMDYLSPSFSAMLPNVFIGAGILPSWHLSPLVCGRRSPFCQGELPYFLQHRVTLWLLHSPFLPTDRRCQTNGWEPWWTPYGRPCWELPIPVQDEHQWSRRIPLLHRPLIISPS